MARKRLGAEKTRVSNLLSKVKIVASNGVDFDFYEPWYAEDWTEEMFQKIEDKHQMLSLEMELASVH